MTRLGQAFDHAPICDRVRVTGRVTKPREMWALSGANQFVGTPLFTADGKVAGMVAVQQGAGENAPSRPFLVPIDRVSKVVERAKKEAEKTLAEIREARAEEEADSEDEEEGDDDEAPGPRDAPPEDEDDGGK